MSKTKATGRVKFWVLRDGRNYFRQWTGIGPCATQQLDEAMRFRTRRLAMMSPAYTFSLTFYEPVAIR